MLFKLAIKNIKKSIKDYSIYFFTLVVAVAIFYTFNSIGSQQSMMILNDSKRDMIEVLVMIIGYISVFVSIILGFLIVYSNNFLIKRRKKEFGLYMTLGMSKWKVSTILVLETLLVGILSLATGLILGIFASQFISIFTAKLFEANLTAYKFVYSSDAIFKTLLYFSIIFILVMIFNVISLGRHKLINLLTASRQNEKVKLRNKYVVFISFVLSVVLLVYAYHLLFEGTLFYNGPDKEALKMIIAGALGTFLLFFSGSGFMVKAIQLIKGIYYKKLNMFTLKQVNSKLNTTVFSTTIISLMLLLTIGILSGSMSLSSILNSDLKENNKADFTLDNSVYDYNINQVVANSYKLDTLVNENGFDDYISRYVTYNKYNSTVILDDIIDDKAMEDLLKTYGDTVEIDTTYKIPIILESDYQNIKKFFSEEYIDIADDEYLLMCNIDGIVDLFNHAYHDNNEISINGYKLKPATYDIDREAIENYNGQGNDGIIIISDKYKNDVTFLSEFMLGDYVKGDNEKTEKAFFHFLMDNNTGEGYSFKTKIDMQNSSVGTKAILTFVGLYLGIIFAISSATVLAIGQLSEASDNKARYKIIKQLGADNKMIKKTLFVQIAIAFILPLMVAIVHAIFGLREFNKIVKLLANINLTSNILLTSLFIIVVYGGYFLATYLVSKNIINEK